MLRVLDQTGSTNDDARGLARAGAPHGTAVAARRQTAGRGRRGHAWDSPTGNLYLSVVLRPRVAASRLAGLAAACGVGALHGLHAAGCGNEAQLKWPNDLLARGRKLGGILVEVEGGAAVCGVGVNVADAPCDLGAIALAELGPQPGLQELAEALRSAILAAVDTWAASEGERPLDGILDCYLDLLAWRGEKVRVLSLAGDEITCGTLEGVDVWGRAVVDGTPFASERASLRLA